MPRGMQTRGAVPAKSENPAWGEAGLSDGVKPGGSFRYKTRQRDKGSSARCQKEKNPARGLRGSSKLKVASHNRQHH